MPVEFKLQNTENSSDSTRLTMMYDGSGRRVAKTRARKAAGATDWETELVTHYTGIGTEVRENLATETPETQVVVNMPQGLGRYGLEDAGGPAAGEQTFEWYLKNHLGSTMLVYGTGGTSGGLKAAYDYRSFGEQITLTAPPTGKVTENFTGKERDDETQLNYFGARYLDPMLGMWISVDPKRQFASPYLYAGNGMNPVNVVDPDGNRVFGTYNRTTGEVYLVDENEKRGEKSFFAISGYKNQKDDTKFGGPIPQGKYAIIEDPWNKRDNWFGLFYKDDERFDDYIQGGSSDGRGEFRFHRFINLSLGCISAKTKTEEDYLKIYEWIKGTETQKVKDADGIWHIDYGEIEVITDDD